ncbi:MAG: hypothetical protein HY286_06475 [Planctomycetes bacterium]|nr:hypothetical protein [Planctomycetota bacterium]
MFHGSDVLNVQGLAPGASITKPESRATASAPWSLDVAERIVLRENEYNLRTTRYSPDGQNTLTAPIGNDAVLWDLQGKQQLVFHGHEAFVYSADTTARVWHPSGGEPTVLRGHRDLVFGASFSSDRQHVLMWSDDKTVRLWDLDGRELTVLRGHEDRVRSAVLSRNGE